LHIRQRVPRRCLPGKTFSCIGVDIELNRGIAEDATKNWTFVVANIDGIPIANPSSYWNAPVRDTNVDGNCTITGV